MPDDAARPSLDELRARAAAAQAELQAAEAAAAQPAKSPEERQADLAAAQERLGALEQQGVKGREVDIAAQAVLDARAALESQ